MEIKFHKVTSLPGTLEPNAWYLVENGTYVETYVTNSIGVAKMIGNSVMINQLIASQLSGLNQTYIVANIVARNTLSASLNRNAVIQVIDATGDASVVSGGATYLWDSSNSISIKISEFESMDLVLQWNSIQGKPTSTPSQIDTSVANSHVHSNKLDVLDLLSVVNGVLFFNGVEVKNWNTLSW